MSCRSFPYSSSCWLLFGKPPSVSSKLPLANNKKGHLLEMPFFSDILDTLLTIDADNPSADIKPNWDLPCCLYVTDKIVSADIGILDIGEDQIDLSVGWHCFQHLNFDEAAFLIPINSLKRQGFAVDSHLNRVRVEFSVKVIGIGHKEFFRSLGQFFGGNVEFVAIFAVGVAAEV